MNKEQAKQLCNGDEVLLVEENEIITVLNTMTMDGEVYISAMTSLGYRDIHCSEIE